MARSFVDPLGLRFLLLFELDGRQHPVPDVFALRVVEHFDTVEHILPGFVSRTVNFSAYPLALLQIEEALLIKMKLSSLRSIRPVMPPNPGLIFSADCRMNPNLVL